MKCATFADPPKAKTFSGNALGLPTPPTVGRGGLPEVLGAIVVMASRGHDSPAAKTAVWVISAALLSRLSPAKLIPDPIPDGSPEAAGPPQAGRVLLRSDGSLPAPAALVIQVRGITVPEINRIHPANSV